MNIFTTHANPEVSAISLDDLRLNKMVLETAQLLSTAGTLNGAISPYKPTHAKHPCTIWTSTNKTHYNWLLQYFKALCDNYTYRFGKIHACASHYPTFFNNIKHLSGEIGNPNHWPNCTTYDSSNIFNNYKYYLKDKWLADKRPPKRFKLAAPSLDEIKNINAANFFLIVTKQAFIE
jgi:hypothetical protein